jgi:hypothetical protein
MPASVSAAPSPLRGSRSATRQALLAGILCTGLMAATGCSSDSNPPASGSGGTTGNPSGGTGGTTGGQGGTTGTPGAGGTTSANGGASGSSGLPGSGGTPGGSGGGTGQSDAGGGAGGAGMPPAGFDGGASATCNIPCIANIDNECRAMGACMEQTGLLGTNNRCYANGVKIINDVMIGLMPSLTTTQKKPDGSICFTMTGTLSGQSATLVWKNAAGATVATGTYDTMSMKAKIMCGAQSYDATPGDACASKLNLPTLPGMTAPPSSCTRGTCM